MSFTRTTLLAPLVLQLLLGLGGCLKARAKKGELGPEVSVDQINASLMKAAQSDSLHNIALGQSVSFSNTRRIENSESTINLGERKIEVIDRMDLGRQYKFTLRITNSQRLSSGHFETTVNQDYVVLKKSGKSSAPSELNLLSLDMEPFAATAPSKERVTYHNLRESDGTIDPPTAVKLRSGCAGLANCSLPVHYIQFDMAVWADSTNYQKYSIDFAFSNQTPYLPFGNTLTTLLSGALVVDCRSTFIPIQGRTVYVRDCLSLDDFQK